MQTPSWFRRPPDLLPSRCVNRAKPVWFGMVETGPGTKPPTAAMPAPAPIVLVKAPKPDRAGASALWARLMPLAALVLFSVGQVSCQERTPGPNAFGLRTTDLHFGRVKLVVEVADTEESRSTGLMYRASLPSDHGMLFVFDQPMQANFWMKNTKIPLSIGFLDSSGKLLETRDMQPFSETLTTSRSDRVAYALEVNQGWFERNHVLPGVTAQGLSKR
ncbi:MAG: DUF192 domain-containing protein [Verrucomicrobia bacterium]|nr:DUF192 domain-containing protein [Verrucomicrobiota bacterium]